METLSYCQLMQRCGELESRLLAVTEQRDAVVAELAGALEDCVYRIDCTIVKGNANLLDTETARKAHAVLAGVAELEGTLNLASASYAGERERADALQDRKLTVKLPRVMTFEFASEVMRPSGAYVNVEAMNKALAAAGITLNVGGE